MNLIAPPRLQAGDFIGICSPSGTIEHKKEMFERAKVNFENATGLQALLPPNIYAKHFYSAGTPQQRLEDFHSLVANPDVKAVIFSAGGDTAIDLIQHIDYDLVQKNPKILAGISDATTILDAITAKTGLITFLGLEFLDYAGHDMKYELESLKQAWFEGTFKPIHENPEWKDLDGTHTAYCGWQTIRGGTAIGHLIGGNLESFLQLVGTEYEPHFDDEILFVETYKLPKKQIHKALLQLELRGVLKRVKGIVVGYCLNCDDTQVVGNEQPIANTFLEATEKYSWPIMQIGEIGHRVENCMQPIGARCSMNADTLDFEILDTVTI